MVPRPEDRKDRVFRGPYFGHAAGPQEGGQHVPSDPAARLDEGSHLSEESRTTPRLRQGDLSASRAIGQASNSSTSVTHRPLASDPGRGVQPFCVWPPLVPRSTNTVTCAHGACEALSRRADAGWSWLSAEEAQRRNRPQPPYALWVRAARGHLLCCRSSEVGRPRSSRRREPGRAALRTHVIVFRERGT